MIISGVLGLTEIILILCIPLFFLLLPIIAIVDILRSRFERNRDYWGKQKNNYEGRVANWYVFYAGMGWC